MSINAVSIDEYNIPILSSHEIYLHSLNNVIMTAEWGQGYPGLAGTINPTAGTVFLTPFRLIFVPNQPTEQLYSVCYPLIKISSIKQTFDMTPHARDYSDRLTIPHQFILRNMDKSNPFELGSLHLINGIPDTDYQYLQADSDRLLSFQCGPCHNVHIPEVDLYSDILTEQGKKPLPNLRLTRPPERRIDHPITCKLLLRPNSICTIHNNLQADPPLISCYHHDFVFSLTRSCTLATYITRCALDVMRDNPSRSQFLSSMQASITKFEFPLPADHKQDKEKSKDGYQPFDKTSDRTNLASSHSPRFSPPRQRTDSPLLLGYHLAAHSTQPMELLTTVASALNIHPLEVYSEWEHVS